MYSPQSDGDFNPKRLIAALRASHCGTWQWDIVNNVVDWDEALSDLYGIEHKNAPKTAEEFLALVHPDDRERILGDARLFRIGYRGRVRFSRYRKRQDALDL
jgi:PAS domain-containing protein